MHHLDLLAERYSSSASATFSLAWCSRLLEVGRLEVERILLLETATVSNLGNQLLEIAWLQALLLPMLL
jgi:hypothetical protein